MWKKSKRGVKGKKTGPSRKTSGTGFKTRLAAGRQAPEAVAPFKIFGLGTFAACALFALMSALFLWPFLIHPTWVPGSGDMAFVWVYRHVWIESLKRGYPMLWNPYSTFGQPLLANCNPQDYAPLNFLFFIFSTSYALTWSYFFHFILAAFGAYLFIRSLGSGALGACLGGLAFGFSAFFMAHFVWGGHNSINGASWLPLALYGLKRFVDSNRFSALLVAAGAFGLGALDGTPQYDLYTLMAAGFLLLWAWAWGKLDGKAFLGASLSFLGIGLSLGLCQLAPTYQLSRLSERNLWTTENIMRDAFVPSNLRFLINPFFAGTPDNYHGVGGYAEVCIYLGLVPLFLALGGMALLWRRPWVAWLGLTVVLSMCLAMADTTTVTHYIYLFFAKIVPGLSQNRQPSRIMVVTTLALASLAGLALDAWAGYWRDRHRLPPSSRQLLALGVPAFLLLGTVVDLYRFDSKHAVGFGGSDQFYSDLFPSDLLKMIKSDPTYPRAQPNSTYTEYQLLQNISAPFTDCTSFSILMSKRYSGELYNHPDTSLSDLVRLSYNYRPEGSKPTDRWQPIHGISVPVWQNAKALPRAFMVGGYEVEPDYNQAITEIRDGKVDPRQEVVLTREPSENPEGPKGWLGEGRITRYDYNDVDIEAANDRPCFLFLSDSFYPGWKAWVDGKEAPIYLADGAFRAVPLLSAGSHQVKMSYYPPIITVTFFYSLFFWLALACGFLFREKLDHWCSSHWVWLKHRRTGKGRL